MRKNALRRSKDVKSPSAPASAAPSPGPASGGGGGAGGELIDPRLLLQMLVQVRKGDFTVRLPGDRMGVAGKLHDVINAIVHLQDQM